MSWPGTSMWSTEQPSARPHRSSNEPPRPPRIAVVISNTGEVSTLRSCLEHFAPCCSGAELIVVSPKPPSELASVVRAFREPSYLGAPATATLLDLRRIGFLAASSNVVAFVDDFAIERHAWTADVCARWPNWAGVGGRVGTACITDGARRPALSVVMPVRNGGTTLRSALEAMLLSDLPRPQWELIVVDDASTDDTAAIAAQFADRLVRLPGRAHGPGYARNRGFELTLGEVITFANADVMVRPETLRSSVTALMEAPDVGAVFGSYDTHPRARGLVSQYRNLLQHYYLQQNAGDSSTFSSSCGTIRANVFEQSGGYDEWHFTRRQLEDLELGQRIRRLGHRIRCVPEIRATNLKRWTLLGMMGTEIFDRGVPWMRVGRRQVAPAPRPQRSSRTIKRANIAFTWLAGLFGLAAWQLRLPALALGSVACVALILANNSPQLSFFKRERGVVFAVATIALDLLYYGVAGFGIFLGWIAQQAVGEPRPGATEEAFSEMDVRRWPPVPVRRLVDHPPSSTGKPSPAVKLRLEREPPPLPGAAAEGPA